MFDSSKFGAGRGFGGEALVDAMEDGSIFGLPRVTGDLAWKRLRRGCGDSKLFFSWFLCT